MGWDQFWRAMTKPEQTDYSERVGSTRGSIYYGYVYGDKTPRPEKLARMVVESNNRLPVDEAVEHFFTKKVREEIQRLQKEENPASGV